VKSAVALPDNSRNIPREIGISPRRMYLVAPSCLFGIILKLLEYLMKYLIYEGLKKTSVYVGM